MNQNRKRIIDVTLASIGLAIAFPFMAITVLLVWLDSPSNVIFTQERLGFRGKRFRLYKFRKFPVHLKDEGPYVTVAGDTRMTRIGAILERTKLDELPQLWNILKGEMSFVGPRPETLNHVNLFIEKYGAVLDYIPGIFGPNQVAFRNESRVYPPDEDPEMFYRRILFPQKAESDIRYFQKANCLTDIIWMIKGIRAIIAGLVN